MDITSANAKCFLMVEDLFPAGILLQGYASDDAVSEDERQIAVTRMGVDGRMAAGYTPQPYIMHFRFEANSESIPYIRAIVSFMQSQKKIVKLGLAIGIPSRDLNYLYSRGVITNAKDFPDIKTVLDHVTVAMAFESRT